MKILDFETIKDTAKQINPVIYFDWIEYVMYNQSEFKMPVKSRMNQDDGNYYACMPAMWEKNNVAMLKMIGRHNLKPGENRSVMMSDMMLYEANTGILKALMDGEYITTLRTGALAAFSALLYGKKNFQTLGLIGLGNIMSACFDVFFAKTKDRRLIVKLLKHNNQEKRFRERYCQYNNIIFVECETYEEVIKDSDLIFSALTRIDHNFCEKNTYKLGCTVIPIMTMGFQNCDLFFDKVFTDEINQIRGFKYFNQFRLLNNTTDVLNGNAKGRENDEERIIVYNYGLSILDLYFAEKFLQLEDQKGININYLYCKEKYFM